MKRARRASFHDSGLVEHRFTPYATAADVRVRLPSLATRAVKAWKRLSGRALAALAEAPAGPYRLVGAPRPGPCAESWLWAWVKDGENLAKLTVEPSLDTLLSIGLWAYTGWDTHSDFTLTLGGYYTTLRVYHEKQIRYSLLRRFLPDLRTMEGGEELAFYATVGSIFSLDDGGMEFVLGPTLRCKLLAPASEWSEKWPRWRNMWVHGMSWIFDDGKGDVYHGPVIYVYGRDGAPERWCLEETVSVFQTKLGGLSVVNRSYSLVNHNQHGRRAFRVSDPETLEPGLGRLRLEYLNRKVGA